MSTNKISPDDYKGVIESAQKSDPHPQTSMQPHYDWCKAELYEKLGSVRHEILAAIEAVKAVIPGLAAAEDAERSGVTVTYHFILASRHCEAIVRPLPHRKGGEFNLSGPDDQLLRCTYGEFTAEGMVSNADPAETIADYVVRNMRPPKKQSVAERFAQYLMKATS